MRKSCIENQNNYSSITSIFNNKWVKTALVVGTIVGTVLLYKNRSSLKRLFGFA